jgi:putative peptide zinc metalloprotease protein
MSVSLFSPSWYRVAQLKPRLRGHARVHRHDYRDEVWYVLQDNLSGKFHRFSEGANEIIGLMDGERNVEQIWNAAAEVLGDDSPTQEEMIRLLAQLHSADVLQTDAPPDSEELFKRYRQQERARIKQRVWSPLALRFKLFDPERFLAATLPLVRPLFTRAGFLLWLLVVMTALVLTVMHWSELSNNMVDRVLAPQNLLILWLVYPFVKTIHELGHAYATRVWGGEVHDIGLMLLVFMPVPYVDASTAAAFRQKHRRMLVGAIGIMVELFLAAIALLVWLHAEYGVVRAIAYNVMLIGGVSTLFFNGNPLLRFDGYYVLADMVEIPNLAKRSQTYLAYLAQRYLFGLQDAVSPATGNTERKWFVFYGVASFVYRMFIAVAIILFVAGQFFVIGILLSLWAAFTMLLLPLGKSMKFLLTSPKLASARPRALMVSLSIFGLLFALLFLLPVPYRTMAEGVVWLPDKAAVRAGTACFVRDYVADSGRLVKAGETLLVCEDPLLDSRRDSLDARLRELQLLLASQWRDDRVAARITEEEIKAVKADLADVQARIEALSIKGEVSGRFIVPNPRDLPGRYVSQGEILGYVLEQRPMSVRVVVPEEDAVLVRSQTHKVQVQLVDRPGISMEATIVRQAPGGSNNLPSAVLGKEGGGRIDIDPRDAKQTRTFTRVFEYDLALPAGAGASPAGTRAYVRFDHGRAPFAYQWYRQASQVFLGKFGA